MTTSSSTDWMNHPELRRLVDDANRLTLAERATLIKGLIPSIADDQTPEQFAALQKQGIEQFGEIIKAAGIEPQ